MGRGREELVGKTSFVILTVRVLIDVLSMDNLQKTTKNKELVANIFFASQAAIVLDSVTIKIYFSTNKMMKNN